MQIGVHGKLGSGKDTVLERLQHLYPGVFVRHSFADKLKDSACALSQMTRETMEMLKRDESWRLQWVQFDPEDDPTMPPNMIAASPDPMTMRTFLQRYGTESHRDIFGDSFWVDQAMDSALKDEQSGLTPVFTDIRFPNEGEAVLANLTGGEVWCITGLEQDTGHHASETPLPDEMITAQIDNTVRGDGFAHLDRQLKEQVERIRTAGLVRGILDDRERMRAEGTIL